MTQGSTEQRMADAGVPTTEPVYEDYFGFEESHRWYFPDKKQYIEFQIMNEGAKARFQKMTNKDITLERTSGNARMKVDPAEERHALIVASVTGWNVVKNVGTKDEPNWQPVAFSKGSPGAELEKWLAVANPKHVEDLEFEIRKANPWLQAEMTVEEIDKEMDRLRELREQAIEREQGKSPSANK